jgi:deoxyuridine 5'-triphosphate nucleotidohydrolase
MSDKLPSIQLKRLHPEAILPFRGSFEAAGLDISACLISETGRPSKRLVSSQQTISIPTGWSLRPPDGFCTLVLSRSGLAASNPPLFVANSPGLIDPDYTGEIKILLFNGGFNAAYIEHGQRIAQLIFIRRHEFPFIEVESLPETVRGPKGFGSTG